MLVTLKEILQIAEKEGTAIGSFNTPNLTTIEAVIGAAEELGQPVIISHAQLHEEMGLCKMEYFAPIMLLYAQKATVPVCVHLDHGTDMDYVRRGLQLGFTSVMYDSSALPEAENTANTRAIVLAAARTGASVEAEIGSMGSREGGGAAGASIYTDPDAAVRFVAGTGIDALACAFGTAHGFYKGDPQLDFERLEKIRGLVRLPIVMHGGSGVSPADYRRAIRCGVRKINYYTYMAKAGGDAISGKTYVQFHDAMADARQAMQADVRKALAVFGERD